MKVWDSTICKVMNIERYISKLYQVPRKTSIKIIEYEIKDVCDKITRG